MQTDVSPFVHPVLRAILLHFMIGYDHPFVDSSSRAADLVLLVDGAQRYWLMGIHQPHPEVARQSTCGTPPETDQNDTTYFLLHQLATSERPSSPCMST